MAVLHWKQGLVCDKCYFIQDAEFNISDHLRHYHRSCGTSSQQCLSKISNNYLPREMKLYKEEVPVIQKSSEHFQLTHDRIT